MPRSINGNVSFFYNGAGSRTKKVSPTASTVYIGKLYECTNDICEKHIYAGSSRIALKTIAQTFYHHTDHLGSTTVVTDYNGAVVETLAYYPFGGTQTDDKSVYLNYKYTGQELDSETGLYNYNARLYDPELGRFLTADTIVPNPENPQSLNRYSYVVNNPLMYTDPTGHDFWSDFVDFFVRVLDSVCSEGCGAGVDSNKGGYAYTGNNYSNNNISNNNYNVDTSGNSQLYLSYYGGGSYGQSYDYSNSGGIDNSLSSAFSYDGWGGSSQGDSQNQQAVGQSSSGKTWTGIVGVNGVLGGQIFPTVPGGYVSGGLNIGFNSKGQFLFQFQANGMTGVGYFAGIGFSGTGGRSNGNAPLYSVDRALHVEGNAGWGPFGGFSADGGNGSLSIGKGLRGGAGFGAMLGAGMSQFVTLATPTLW